MEVSWNGGTPSYHQFLARIFPYKPSSYWAHPFMEIPKCQLFNHNYNAYTMILFYLLSLKDSIIFYKNKKYTSPPFDTDVKHALPHGTRAKVKKATMCDKAWFFSGLVRQTEQVLVRTDGE